ncbi:hypothetical protein MoryE10_03160 [Methylogaea oryzae]|uniref:Uncharacterized protein n=1 Tax=Methylogaea oryzae TaxID=1295382 RepID=A0A8D4VL07_9GAMM|nr:hypothetical protein MoryE10_03160 [Methylogaea oryzae]
MDGAVRIVDTGVREGMPAGLAVGITRRQPPRRTALAAAGRFALARAGAGIA